LGAHSADCKRPEHTGSPQSDSRGFLIVAGILPTHTPLSTTQVTVAEEVINILSTTPIDPRETETWENVYGSCGLS